MSMLEDDLPHHLVLVGGDGWDVEAVYALLGDSTIRHRVHFLGYVNDSQLRSLYRGASAYVHPSLYEGFGLTLLEAMACECPVVTSRVYSLPEVAGEAAVLVDPVSVPELAQAIRDICTDETLAGSLREKGRQRAAGFRWDRCAGEVAAVYRKVAG